MTRLQQDHSVDQLDGQTHHQVLEAFAEDEARSYIIQRYKAAQSLSEDQLRQLFVISGGLPGGLNQAVENLFRAGEISQEKSARGLPRMHLISIATVLIGVLLISLWQYWPEEQPGEDVRERVQLELPVTPEAKEAATIVVTEEPATRKILPIPSLEPERKAEKSELKTPEADAKPETVVVQTAKPEKSAYIIKDEVKAKETVQTPVKPVKSQTSAKPVIKAEQQPVVKLAEDTLVEEKPVVPKPATKTESVKPAEVAAAVIAKPAKAEPKSTVKPEPLVTKPAVKVAAKPAVKEKPVVKPKPTAQQLSVSEKALLEWPTSGYTLQVLGAGLKKSADDFIRGQKEPQKFYLFRTTYKGNPWYVVVYGQYKSRQSASAASKSLPDDLRKLQPWARSIQGIQSEIKK